MTSRAAVVFLLFAITLSHAQTTPARPDLAGTWVDSQGNRFTMAARGKGSRLSLECPLCDFRVGDRAYTRSLAIDLVPAPDGALAGGDELTGTSAVVRGPQLPSGMLRLTVHVYPAESVELAMARADSPAGQGSGQPPARVAVTLTQASTVVGKWVPMWVSLADSDGKLTAPTSETLVTLDVNGGSAVPQVVRITPDQPQVPAGIVMSTAHAALTASAPGLTRATENATGCEQRLASDLQMKISAPRDQALADGRDPIPVVFSLVDENDTPATDGKPKQFGFEVAGVGRLADASASAVAASVIPAGQCADQRTIVAQTAGVTKVSAEFRGRKLVKSLVFRPVLTAVAVALAVGGGGVGGFVSAARDYKAVRRWRARRWVYWFFSACIGGLALYLAYFYGLLKQMATAPNASGFAFLAGIIGGFLGAAAIELIHRSVTGEPAPKSAVAGD